MFVFNSPLFAPIRYTGMYASPELGGPSRGPLALRTRPGLLRRLGATSLGIGHPRAYGWISADMRSDFFGARCAAILSEGFSRHTAATLLPSGSLGAVLSPASRTAAKLLGLFGTGGGPVSGNLVPGDLKRRSSPNLAMRTASSGPLDTSMASRVTGSGVLVKTGASP